VPATETDRVAVPPEVTEVGLIEAVTPVGAPLTDSPTVCAPPEVVAVLTVALVLLPAATVAEPGFTEIEKSLPGLVPVTVAV
jgi:hypothetical protein